MRQPVVAGQFYPDDPKMLEKSINSFLDKNSRKAAGAIGAIVPHAGYIFSGRVAGSVYSVLPPKKIFIVIGPNHSGSGAVVAIDQHHSWLTPLGEVGIDIGAARKITEKYDGIIFDSVAHNFEHSIEVQLPFLQMSQNNFMIVPISVLCGDIDSCAKTGRAIALAIKELAIENEVIIIASSDMTHYESQAEAEMKDRLAIKEVEEIDARGLINVVEKNDISMCGYAPAAIMLSACKELGAKKGKLISYETSGNTSGDYDSVVGYAGILVS